MTAAVPINLGSGANYTLRIVPTAIVAPASTVANAFGDTLTITTNSPGDAPHVVQLNETARGAFLSLTPLSLVATNLSCANTTFHGITITNSGNVSIGYTISAVGRAGTPVGTFTIPSLTSGSLFGGQSQSGNLEILTPPTGGASTQYLGDIVLAPGAGVLCSDTQPKVPLSMTTPCVP